MIKQFFLIVLPLFLGYLIVDFTGLPIPANVVGMVLLFLALCFGLLKLKDVDKISDAIIKYLAVFFIVPTVGVMVYFDLIGQQAVKILVPLIVSILLGFFAAGKTTEIAINLIKKGKDKKACESEVK